MFNNKYVHIQLELSASDYRIKRFPVIDDFIYPALFFSIAQCEVQEGREHCFEYSLRRSFLVLPHPLFQQELCPFLVQRLVAGTALGVLNA
jgi:hypothetical protein